MAASALAVSTCIHWLVEAWRKSRQSIKLVLWASYCSANYRHFIRIIKTRYSYTVNICLRINFRLSLRINPSKNPTPFPTPSLSSSSTKRPTFSPTKKPSQIPSRKQSNRPGIVSLLERRAVNFLPKNAIYTSRLVRSSCRCWCLGRNLCGSSPLQSLLPTTGFAGTTQRVRIG
jgi:hypothetical protein